MKHFQHSPEVQEAIKIFEEKTGIKVLKARRYSGSMRSLVNFVIPVAHSQMFQWFYGDHKVNGKRIGGIEITFIRPEYGKEDRTSIDIEWKALGMSKSNAVINMFRGI